MSRRHYVLRVRPRDMKFYDTLQDALYALAAEQGLRFSYGFVEEMADDLFAQVYLEAEQRALLRLVTDERTPAVYLIAEAATPGEVEALGEGLARHLPVVPPEELRREAREGAARDPRLLVRAALGAGEAADEETRDILSDALRSPDAAVRFRAAEAMSLTQWRDFVPALEGVAVADPSPEVRRMAAAALDACRGETAARYGRDTAGDS